MEDFRHFGNPKNQPALRAIVQGLAEDKKHAIAFKQGDMAQFGVAVAEILEVDGDQVYARLGPNTGWYEKEEVSNLGLDWKSAEEFNKRDVSSNNQLVEARKRAQVRPSKGAFYARKKSSPFSTEGLFIAWPEKDGFKYHLNTGKSPASIHYLPADEFWREFENFDRRKEERVAISPFFPRSQFTKQDTATPLQDLEFEESEELEFEESEEDDQSECPACGGPIIPMGNLGNIRWYRCRNCGMDVSKGSHTASKKRKADERVDAIVRSLESGQIDRPTAIRKLSNLAVSQPEAVKSAFMKIRITPEESERLQSESRAFTQEGGVTTAPRPVSSPSESIPEEGKAESIPEEGKAEAIPEKFMDKYDVQKQIDGLLDRYNSGEISLEKLRYRMKDLVIRKGCKHQVRKALMERFAPRSHIMDEDVWDKAKNAADKSYDKSDDFYWAAVTDIYKNMGGRMKKKKKAQNLLMSPESTMYYALKTIRLMTNDRSILGIIDIAIKRWDNAKAQKEEEADLPPANLISQPDMPLGEGEDQMRPID